jgi:signal transduction protein with GAF and PtsI domain
VKEAEHIYLLAFMNISRAISSTLELQEVLNRIVRCTCETTGSKGCTLMLLDEEGERLEVKASYGLSDRYVRKGPLSADKSISNTLRGKPVIIEDATSDPRVQYPLEAKEEGIASIVSLPVILRERVIGVLRLYTSTPCRFTQDDIDFLSAIAVQSGLAINNAKVYEHVKSDCDKRMV